MDMADLEKSLQFEDVCNIVIPIAMKYGVERIYLFGSRARGDSRSDSDYDFCISPGAIDDLFELSGFLCELRDALGQEVDFIYEKSMSSDFTEEVLRDRRLVYEA